MSIEEKEIVGPSRRPDRERLELPQSTLIHPMPRRDFLKVVGWGGVSAALIAACGPAALSASPAGASAASGSSAPSLLPTGSGSIAPVARGGTIRMGSFEGGLVDGWMTWNVFGQQFAFNWCAQRLLSVAPDGSLLYDMAAAHVLSPDGKQYTFTLVDGLTWHDGKPVTANDVAFTYNTALKVKAGSNSSTLLVPLSGSDIVLADNSKDCPGIEVIDDLTIRFTLEEASAKMLPTAFATLWIMPKHPFDGVALEDYAKQPVATDLFIGSGPMRMTEFTPKQFVNFEAFDGYANGAGYQGRPAADKVSIRIYSDENAQVTSTKAGEVDFNYVRKPTGDQFNQYKSIQGMHAQESLVGFNICMAFNLKAPSAPQLLDKRVRQALLWAIDRDTIVKDVLGVGKVPDIMNQWIAPWANASDLDTYAPQDVEKAKALLAEAGWDPSVTLDVRHYPPKITPDVPVIVEMWKAIGVNVKLTPLQDDTFVQDYYLSKGPEGQPDQGPSYDIAFVYGYGSIDGSPWVADQILGSKSLWPDGYNSMRWSSPEWDSEFAAGSQATDEASQAPHFQRCSQIFNDELPYAPLYQEVDYAVIADTLVGPEENVILDPTGGGIRYWEWYIAG